MLYSKILGKTQRLAPSDEESINAKLLIRGGFIDKLMAGSYTLLHLGRQVQRKIEQIIREEMNEIGAEEILMPLLHPKEIWNETGRWDKADAVMYKLKKNDKEYVLSFTHEEIVMDLIRKHVHSYKDLPVKPYQFSTKFRNELRARSGILRGREFIMKDLYSAHANEEDFNRFYEEVAKAYIKIFKRIGVDAKKVTSGGGVFTDQNTHEFQVFCETGEDRIYHCDKCDFAENQEIAKVKEGDKHECGGMIKKTNGIEVGNTFPLGVHYAELMKVFFVEQNGTKSNPWFGSYGIGITRLIGTIVEVSNDDKGIIWPESVAPYKVYLISINKDRETEKFYSQLRDSGIEVMYDDRDVTPGEKFNDADLLGIPYRVVVSAKQKEGEVETKKRSEKDTKIVSFENLLDKLIV